MATGWTAQAACALQATLRMSNDTFARHLQLNLRTVAGWHETPPKQPRPDSQRRLDAALARADPAARDRFATLCGQAPSGTAPAAESGSPADDQARAAAEQRLMADQNIGQALTRLDHHAGWEPGTARGQVAARIALLDRRQLLDRADLRRRVGQPAIAQALARYYQDTPGQHGRYGARCHGTAITTSVLTHPNWLDLECPLTAGHDQLTFTKAASDPGDKIDAEAADAAAQGRRNSHRGHPLH